MKIALKNIHYDRHLSEETHAFVANLYINGFKAGVASNQGHGGNTDYHPTDKKGRKLIEEAENYCRNLPPETYLLGDQERTIAMSLELYIDSLVDDYLQQKELQKFRNELDKETKTGIVYGVPDHSFRVASFKNSIETILHHPTGWERLKNAIIKHVIPKMWEGDKILNTNIPGKLMEER